MTSESSEIFYHIVASDLGKIGVLWTYKEHLPVVIHIMLPRINFPIEETLQTNYPGASARSCIELEKICMGIQNLSGDLLVCFSPKFIDMDSCYDFQKTVLLETAQVPKGRVISYGCLAKRIFAPRAARAIGSALAKNPFPLIIPCHRVVRSDGNPGDFGGGSDMKKFLLQKEGIDLNLAGKIDAEYFIV